MGDGEPPPEGRFHFGCAMRRAIAAICLALLAARSAGALRALQGRWDVVRAVIDGKDAELPRGRVYEFSGRRMTKPSSVEGTVYLVKVGGGKPWRMAITPQGGGRPFGAVFKVEKGELFLSITQDGPTPPENLSGTESPVIVLKKQRE
jgi:hypothetical protein